MVAWRIAMRSAHLANYDVPHDCYQIIRPSFIRIPALMISTERNLRRWSVLGVQTLFRAMSLEIATASRSLMAKRCAAIYVFLSTLVNRF